MMINLLHKSLIAPLIKIAQLSRDWWKIFRQETSAPSDRPDIYDLCIEFPLSHLVHSADPLRWLKVRFYWRHSIGHVACIAHATTLIVRASGVSPRPLILLFFRKLSESQTAKIPQLHFDQTPRVKTASMIRTERV